MLLTGPYNSQRPENAALEFNYRLLEVKYKTIDISGLLFQLLQPQQKHRTWHF